MQLIRQLWYILGRKERLEGALLLGAMALGAVFEALGISLVVPFIAVLNDPDLVLKAPAAQRALSLLDIREPRSLAIVLGVGLAAAFVAKSGYLVVLYRWLFRYIFARQVSLTRQLLTVYLNAPYAFHLQRNSAELIKVTTATVMRFTTGFLVVLLGILAELLVVAALIVLLLLVSPVGTLGAVLALGVPAALLYRAMQRRLAAAGRIVEQSTTAVIQWTEQSLSGIKETLIMGRSAFFIDRQSHHAHRFADAQSSMMLLSTLPRLVIDTPAVVAMVALALLVPLDRQDMQSALPVLGMFAVAAMRLMPSTSRIAAGLTGLRFHYAAVEVLYRELQETERQGLGQGLGKTRAAVSPPQPFRHSLVLENVSYRYPSAPRFAVDAVSLEIPRGHWVGLVGPTGAGKTTLVDLMLGLFVPTYGRILVDGRDLQDNVAGWQRNIGYVPQDVYLMDDTIRRNVAFGMPDAEIDDARVWQALRSAQLDQLVASLRGGLDATTGERGDRLSGGERQRLGIARALYHDPEVLVVDEGTANLDNETEAAIVNTLAGLRGRKTIIVIAHRLGMVKDCDRVYLLRQGRVCNAGLFADLCASDPAFREFAGDAA